MAHVVHRSAMRLQLGHDQHCLRKTALLVTLLLVLSPSQGQLTGQCKSASTRLAALPVHHPLSNQLHLLFHSRALCRHAAPCGTWVRTACQPPHPDGGPAYFSTEGFSISVRGAMTRKLKFYADNSCAHGPIFELVGVYDYTDHGTAPTDLQWRSGSFLASTVTVASSGSVTASLQRTCPCQGTLSSLYCGVFLFFGR